VYEHVPFALFRDGTNPAGVSGAGAVPLLTQFVQQLPLCAPVPWVVPPGQETSPQHEVVEFVGL
jgi:hypothetical protein